MCQLHSSPKNQISLSPKLAFKPPTALKKRATRLKFWEMKSRYHCAVLGTCLTLKELRIIAKKADIDDINQWDDYDMHVSFIRILSDKSHISILVTKALDQKYALIIKQLSKTKNEDNRIDVWNKAVETGDVAGAFWAILTHPHTTEETMFQLYGKVHMLSHLSGASARIDMKEFYNLEQENKGLAEKNRVDNLNLNKKIQKRELQLANKKEQLSEVIERTKQLELAQQELDAIKKSPLVVDLQSQLA
ncbi:MAG TPA: hypothetical protein EYG71_04795, partial [Leucothrix sp.]|nr:hypothetical protein [Leucothrix sp.]